MPATDGGVPPTSPANRSSLPNQPEIVTLSAVEHLLHNAAQRRGQGEGAAQAAEALTQAANHYAAQPGDPAQVAAVEEILRKLSRQFGQQATRCQREQNQMLGQWIIARNSVGAPAEAAAPRRIGWAVRAWRATVARTWSWAFAK